MFRGQLILAGFVLLAAWAATVMPSPLRQPVVAAEQQRPEQGVEAQGQSAQGNQPAQNEPPPVDQQLVPPPENQQPAKEPSPEEGDGVDLATWIEAIFIAVTGIFTAVLAIATIKLWDSTKGMHEETKRLAALADEQSRDMKASIAVATRSAKAAEDAVTVASRNAQAELRPYVFGARNVTMVDFQRRPDGGHYIAGYGSYVEWVNVGVTPAAQAQSWIRSKIFPKGQASGYRFARNENPVFFVLGPKSKGDSSNVYFTIEEMVDCWEGKLDIIVWWRVEYRGINSPEVVHHHESSAILQCIHDPREDRPADHPSGIQYQIWEQGSTS